MAGDLEQNGRPPRMRADGRRSRAALIDAALRLFPSDGAGLPLDRVATEAGVARGTMHRHFPTRESLVLAVYEALQAQFELLGQAKLKEPGGAVEVLTTMAYGQLQMRGCFQVLMSSAQGRQELEQVRERSRQMLAEVLEAGRREGVVTTAVGVVDLELFFAMVEGAIVGSPVAAVRSEIGRALEIFFSAALVGRKLGPRAS